MHFPLATIATAALILSASAVPHRGHGKGRNSTDTERGGKGAGRDRFSVTAAPTALPTGGADLSTVSFELPSSAVDRFLGFARAKSGDESSSDKDGKESSGSDGSSDDKESSSGSDDKESSSGSDDKESSSGSDDKESSSGSGDEESSSGSGDESSSGGNSSSGDNGSSSGSGDESSSGSGSGSGDEESSSGSGGSGDQESSSGSGSGSGGNSSGGSSNSTTPSTPSSGGSAASGSFPAAAGEFTLSAPMEVTDFDGGMVKFGRGVSCTSGEGGDSDAVFIVADGGSLSNVIIGADQIEGKRDSPTHFLYCSNLCQVSTALVLAQLQTSGGKQSARMLCPSRATVTALYPAEARRAHRTKWSSTTVSARYPSRTSKSRTSANCTAPAVTARL